MLDQPFAEHLEHRIQSAEVDSDRVARRLSLVAAGASPLRLAAITPRGGRPGRRRQVAAHPHPEPFAHLTAWGETITGIGLTLGLLTGLASLTGFLLALNYGLATQWMSPGQQGFHIVLVALITFALWWGVGGDWRAARFTQRGVVT